MSEMKINGKITILCDNDGVRIKIIDDDSRCKFVEVELTTQQFTSALGRLSNVECKSTKVHGLENVGKTQQFAPFSFVVTSHLKSGDRKTRAIELAKKNCPDGWFPDLYFGSKDSFFYEDDELWARTIIRRWVDKQDQPPHLKRFKRRIVE